MGLISLIVILLTALINAKEQLSPGKVRGHFSAGTKLQII